MSIEAERARIATDPELLTIHAAPIASEAELQASQTREAPVDLGYLHDIRFIGTYAGTIALTFSVASSYNMPTGILTAINQDIGPSANYSNVTILWSITSAIGLIIFGRLSDLFGRRYFVLGSIICGLIGSLMAGEASSINVLVGAQVFCGFAAPAAVSYQIIVGEITPIKHRGYWNSVILFCCSPVQMFGPVIGQLFVKHATWRWTYRMSSIMWFVAFILFFTFYHPPRFNTLHVRHSKKELLRQFDYLGLALYSVGLLLFCLGVSWGGGFLPWKSAGVLVPTIIGGILFVGFFFWEAIATLKSPLVSWAYLKYQPRKFLFPFLSSTIGGMFFYGIFLIWPIEVASVYSDLSSVQQGWYSTAAYAGTLSGSFIGGPLFQTGGHHRLKVIVLNVLMIVFVVGASQTKRNQRVANTVCICLAGATCGCMESCFSLWVAASRSVNNLGLSLGLLGSFRNVAGSISSAIYIAVLSSKTSELIPTRVTAAALAAGLPQGSLPQLFQAIALGTPEVFAAVPGMNGAVAAAIPGAIGDAYVESFRYVFYVVMSFGILGLIFACLSAKDISESMTGYVGTSLYNRAPPSPGDEAGANENSSLEKSSIEARNKEDSDCPQETFVEEVRDHRPNVQ